jgi:hypothetical protein
MEEDYKKIIETLEPFMDQLNQIRKDYRIDKNIGFNIFTSISDIYYRENFHSDIIKNILDPNTEEIGNLEFIKTFLKILKLENSIDIKEIKISREKGHIDILIYDNRNAIIIENKINKAKDQPNQLARYFQYVKTNRQLNVIAIIYLRIDPNKKVDFNFDSEFKEYRDEIERKTKYINVIDISTSNTPQLIRDFFDQIILLKLNDLSKVYLEQYSNLLKHLGGSIMTSNVEKEIIKEIYSDKSKIAIVQDLVSIWNNKNKILGLLILDLIKKQYPDFLPHPDDENNTIIKKIDNDISIGIDKDLSYGFVYTNDRKKGIPSDKMNSLKNILNDEQFAINSKDVENNNYWVWRYFKIDDYIEDIQKIIERLIANVISLEEKYKNVFK